MPGARYNDWHHLRYEGDRTTAARYRAEARKVLGFIESQALFNHMQTYKHVERLSDGTVIVGELNGGIPRVTINVTGTRQPRVTPLTEGFILRFGTDIVTPATLDPALLCPPDEDSDATDWKAQFLSSYSFGAVETPDDVSGSYAGTFGPRSQLNSQLGVGAGWTSPDGELVQWFRGYSGYWPQHYAHPGACYSGHVSIYGHVVAQVTDPTMRVMAAAARDGHLFVWTAAGVWELPAPTPPAAPTICGDVWASQPFGNYFHTYRLYRLPLHVETNALGIQVYKTPEFSTGEVLLEVPLQRAYAAWSFNHDVTQLVSIQLPEKAILYTPAVALDDAGTAYYAPTPDEVATYPETGALRFQITIAHEEDGSVNATFSQAAAGGVVAEEDGVTLELVNHGDYFAGTAQVNYKCGTWELVASRCSTTGGPRAAERHICLHAHLPTRTFVFYHCEYGLDTPRYVRGRYRVFRPDTTGAITEVTAADPAPTDLTPPPSLALDLMLGAVPSVMGQGRVNTAGDAWVWFREWDGITTLLLLTYSRVFATYDDTAPPGLRHDVVWAPIWCWPLVNTQLPVGEHSGAGGVYFGSTAFTGPWTWSWTIDAGDTIPKQLYFNGVRINALGAVTASTAFGATAAMTYAAHIDPPETLVIADEALLRVQAKAVYPGPDEIAFLALLDAAKPFRWGTPGDLSLAVSGFDAALPDPRVLGSSAVAGHTGKPRREQRAGVVSV